MSNQGTIRLKVTNDAPAIEKLWNGRFKLEFLCDNNSPKTDWYSENISSILPDYGILQDTNFGSGVSEDWEAIPASVYPDMRLVETEYVYIRSMGDKRVRLTYETLTASWVEEKDEDTDYELNGLKRVSRTFVALPDTAYDKVVGTSTIDSDGTTLYLGSFKIEKTDAKWSLTEVWLEAGTLSETLDNVGSQKAKVIETIGTDPATPTGYLLASKQESNFEGFQTNRFTFLKPSVLSRNVDTRNNGKLKVETVEAFNEIPTSTISGVQISIRQSDVEGIPTNQYVFALGIGEVERSSETKNQGALTITTVTSLGSPGTATGVQIEATTREEDGYTLFRGVFAQGVGIISVKIDKQYQDTLQIVTTTALGAAQGIDNISSSSREEDGYTIFTNVGATGVGEISNSTEEQNQGAVKINRIVSVGTIPSPIGTIISKSERKSDGHTVYDYSAALGEGRIHQRTRPGPKEMPGSSYTIVRSVGTKITPPGVVISQYEENGDGYVIYEVTSLNGGLSGITQSYKDIVDVEVPGTVDCTTVSVEAGGVSGTIAVPEVTPRRNKKVAATVTVEITTSPSSIASPAYDLGDISCSVTSTNTSLSVGPGATATATSGSNSSSSVGFSQNFTTSARIQVYPGCYLINALSTGAVSYIASSQPVVDNNIISFNDTSTSRTTQAIGKGSTSATGYAESGIIKRSSRPILSTADGTIYYEQITWSV